jgi:hypothetical protein
MENYGHTNLLRNIVTLYCSDFDEMPRSLTLNASGHLYNLSKCYVTSNEFQLLPELRGTTQSEVDLPRIYLPDSIPIATDHEIQQLQELNSKAVQQLEEIRSRVTAPQHNFELDSLLQYIKRHYFKREIIFSIICYVSYPRLRNLYSILYKPKINMSYDARNKHKIREYCSLLIPYNEQTKTNICSTRHETFRRVLNLHISITGCQHNVTYILKNTDTRHGGTLPRDLTISRN